MSVKEIDCTIDECPDFTFFVDLDAAHLERKLAFSALKLYVCKPSLVRTVLPPKDCVPSSSPLLMDLMDSVVMRQTNNNVTTVWQFEDLDADRRVGCLADEVRRHLVVV